MVEDVDRAVNDLAVALRVAVAEQVEQHVLLVMHVDVLVHHDDELRERHLPRAPDRMHHPPRLEGVLLLDLHERAVVEHAADRQGVIDDVRDEHAQQRQENALGGLTQEIVLHRRLADNGGGVDGVLAVRDRGHVIRRIPVG